FEVNADDITKGSFVLTSGSLNDTSRVTVSGPGGATDAAVALNLGEDNFGVEMTGLDALQALLASLDGSDIELSGGADGAASTTDTDYDKIFTAFLKYRDINVICLPGKYMPSDGSGNAVIDSAVAHCESMKNRMLIVDPEASYEIKDASYVSALALPKKSYTALYYPWVKVSNPYYNAETNPGAPSTVLAAPSGFAAGIWAKTDAKRGVWKAPAGIATQLLGASGLEYAVEDDEQDYLNPLGVNALRKLPNYGQVVWGSRTLATKSDPEWRYIPVRRTAMYIEESIYNGIQWAVFEPNQHTLWSALRGNIGNFMNGLLRAGAFQGEKASDAYFVRCGLGDTMTQGDIDAGQVIVIVGFAPVKPAEFVIVRIQQKVSQE
ncbi:MAG: phage tail sheath subtilisin-like domain-containing protein, partial [Mariprofundaceae bacterium]|nr:phage tail sheath subtilisin-like domain-containing protein [Mariprofundaceae bacterium]